ncbi:MAG: hypothetical protein KJ077_30725 [Anaerolineae bacterium]|nr:hypothetical protein [Anaerolineae bacterium]
MEAPPSHKKEIGTQKRANLPPPAFYALRCLPFQQRFDVALGPALTSCASGTLATP